MSVQAPSPKATGEGFIAGGSAAAPSARPQAKAPNFALAWQFVSGLSAGAPPGPGACPPGVAPGPAPAIGAGPGSQVAPIYRPVHSPNVPRAGSPLVNPGLRSPRAVSPPAGKAPAPAPQACSPQVGRLGGGAIGQASSHRVQLANAPKAVGSSHPPWTRHGAGAGLEFSPRPNSPIGVVRIQSPVYKESPRLLLKHPSHPQLHMSPNSGGPQGHGHTLNASSNSAHAPPGHSRFGVGSTSLAPRTTSPPPQSAVANLPRQSHLIPNALATASMAAAATAATSGSQGTEQNSALDPTQPAMKSMIQGPLGPQMKQLPASQMQFQQVHLQQSLQHQLVHLVPPQETDDNVIRKPSSDITQVPSRRVSNATLSPVHSPLLTTRGVAASPTEGGSSKRTPTQLLWTLQAEASGRSLLHEWEARCELPATQRVGLLFQKDFFTSILGEEEVSLVDREQFQIWATDSNSSDRSCSFFLTNFSSRGTMVNNQLLCFGGEQVPLRDGDRIALQRESPCNGMETLLEFRFDLSGSILKDLGAWLLPRMAPAPTLPSMPGSVPVVEPLPPTPREAMAPPPLEEMEEDLDDAASARTIASDPVDGVFFLGVRPLPLFTLELGGQGLHADAEKEDLKIIHGPVAPNKKGVVGSCLPLLLGRSQQRSFWQRVLSSNAFYAMSRQHLQIEVGEEFSMSSSATFHLRNLSTSNPVRICRTILPEEIQAAVPLDFGEKRQLQDNDVIVLNPVQGHSFYLMFSDLWAKHGANEANDGEKKVGIR